MAFTLSRSLPQAVKSSSALASMVGNRGSGERRTSRSSSAFSETAGARRGDHRQTYDGLRLGPIAESLLEQLGCDYLGEMYGRVDITGSSPRRGEPLNRRASVSKLLRTERFEFIPTRLAEVTKKVPLACVEQLPNFGARHRHRRLKKCVDNSSEHFFGRGKYRRGRHDSHAAYLLI
jgi:hypothetical protein